MNAVSLLVAPAWVGDAVMSEPLLRQIAAQDQHPVDVLAPPWVAPVFERMPGVGQVIAAPFAHGQLDLSGRWAIGQQLKKARYRNAYVLPNSLKSALPVAFAGIPNRIGFTGECRYGLLNRRFALDKQALPRMVDRFLALAPGNKQTLTARANSMPVLQVAQQAFSNACQRLGLTPPSSGNGLVILCPGAEYGPAKRWPVSHLAEVITRIDRPVVLLGSAKERGLCESITALLHERVRARVHNLAGQTTLTQALALVAGAHRVLSNDSGVMHMAAGLGVPQVAVFGSSSPLHTPPLNALAQVIWLKADPAVHPALDCAPCFARECRFGHTRCLTEVTPQRVLEALSV